MLIATVTLFNNRQAGSCTNCEQFSVNAWDSYTRMTRVYLPRGREYLENQSLNQLINQSVSDFRGNGLFK